jgi:prepilin-type N-terminal cleavage/methylation domain-containing protein
MIWKNQKGFTLIELLVAMALSLVVLGGVYGVYRVQTHTVKAQEFKMEAQEYARNALDMMTREIRNLGFFPTGAPCTDQVNTAGIVSVAAPATSIQFVYDYRGVNPADPADGDCNDAGENITYTYDANTLDIVRTINDGNGPQTLTAGNVTAVAFRYFDTAGNEITIPANVPANARRISITLTVQSLSTDVQFGGGQTVTMDSNVDLRNRCFPPPCAQM